MARPVAQFALIGIAAVVIVGFTTAVASRRVGEREAVTDARTTTLIKAKSLVEPATTDALATGDPVAVARVAGAVESGVLDGDLVRVKIWRADGTILYSDEERLRGSNYPLGEEQLDAIQRGLIEAEVSDLTEAENRFERRYGRLLEVYLPISTPGGETLLFEAYFRYEAVAASGARIWRSFAPISLGSLVVLEIAQIPLAWSLARRLRQRQGAHEAVLRRALEASDVERRRIASDLHDGVVQDLAGTSLALAAAARGESTNGTSTTELLETSAQSIRAAVSDLRELLPEIYPPNLETQGLDVALAGLVDGVTRSGATTLLDTTQLSGGLPWPAATLLYRAAREALRNTTEHANAQSVGVTAGSDAEHAWVTVRDDGVGFTPALAAARAQEGHFGLRGLDGFARDAGGILTVESTPGRGTTVQLTVPLQ